LGMIGLFIALGLLIYLTMRGVNIIIAAIICSIVVAVSSGLNLETAMTGYYMDGFTGYFASWFLIFLLGAIFGKVMQDTGGADSIADWVSRKMGPQRAVLAVVAACAIMTYGGVSLFVVGFSVYPIAVSLFRKADLPHRFIPGALVFGSISFTMTSPGSPEIQNLIPTEYFNTEPTAGGWVGFVTALFILIIGGTILGRMVKKAVANGCRFACEYTRTSIAGFRNCCYDYLRINGVSFWRTRHCLTYISAYLYGSRTGSWSHAQNFITCLRWTGLSST
jgi:H+/gluconate symporter-like permease